MKFSPKLLARARTAGSMRLLNRFPEWHSARRKLEGTSSEIINVLTSEVAEHWQEPVSDLQFDRNPRTIRTDELDIIYRLRLPARQASKILLEEETGNALKNSGFDFVGSPQALALNWLTWSNPTLSSQFAFPSSSSFRGNRCIRIVPGDSMAALYQTTNEFIPANRNRKLSVWIKGTGTAKMWISGISQATGGAAVSNILEQEATTDWKQFSGNVIFQAPVKSPIFYISAEDGEIYFDSAMFGKSDAVPSWQPANDDVPPFMISESRNNRDLWFIKDGQRLPIYWAQEFPDFFGLAVPTRVACIHDETVEYQSVPGVLGGKYDFWGRWWGESFKIDGTELVKFNAEVPSEEHGRYEIWDLKDNGQYTASAEIELLSVAPIRDFLAVLCRETDINDEEILTIRILNPEHIEPEMSKLLTVHVLQLEDSSGLLTDADSLELLISPNDSDELIISSSYDSQTLHHSLRFSYDYYWADPNDPLELAFRENYNLFGGILYT